MSLVLLAASLWGTNRLNQHCILEHKLYVYMYYKTLFAPLCNALNFSYLKARFLGLYVDN